MVSGNPAKKAPEKVHAYLLLDVIVEQQEGVDVGDYAPQKMEAGEMMLRFDFPGTGTHSFVFEDGPFKTIATGVYVATATVIGDEPPIFDYGNGKIMNLVSLGLESEKILKDQIHEVLDRVKAIVDEKLHGGGDEIIVAIDSLETSLWRKH